MFGIIGRKIGMSSFYDDTGSAIPITIIKAGPCDIVQIKDIDKDGYMFCAGRIFDTFEDADFNYTDDREVFWASGAALFIDATSWEEVGGLDEDFFAHMEEIDLCWRLKNRGHKVGVCGSANVHHLGGGLSLIHI